METPHDLSFFTDTDVGNTHNDGSMSGFLSTRGARGGSSMYQGPSRDSVSSDARHDELMTRYMLMRGVRGGSSMHQGPSRGSMFSGARRGH